MTSPRPRTRPATRRAGPRRVGVAAAAVMTLALGACGGSDSGSDTSDEASASAEPTASGSPSAEPSASPDSSASPEAEAEVSAAQEEYVQAVSSSAQDGDISVRSRVTSTIDSPDGEIVSTVDGVTEVEGDTLTARFDTTLPEASGGEQVRTLIVDGTLYVRAPGIPDGKYQEIDIAEAGGQLGAQLQQQLDQIDPRAQASASVDSIESVEKLGAATVRGEDVTQYRVTQDFESFARSQDNQLFVQLVESGQAPDTLTSTVSLDSDDRVRRSVVELEVQGSSIRTVADFLEYGVEVDITAPPRSQVVQNPTPGGSPDADQGGSGSSEQGGAGGNG